MRFFLDILKSAILAGCAIGLGGYVYLTVGGLAGAVLFSFGLLTVCFYQLHLFTGKSGFYTKENILYLFSAVLFGNVIGCWFVSLVASDAVVAASATLVAGRLAAGNLTNFLLAIPCGFIMTAAVTAVKPDKNNHRNYFLILYGVPLFIMCGFRHSIADAFYYLASGVYSTELLVTWVFIVIGNYVGCNFYRLFNDFDTNPVNIS
jgi:formate/nitrite transporter FocA (FNT family)